MMSSELQKKLGIASSNDWHGDFRFPFKNGVTVFMDFCNPDHYVLWMMYKEPSNPEAKVRWVNFNTLTLEVDDHNAKEDFYDLSSLPAYLEFASKLKF